MKPIFISLIFLLLISCNSNDRNSKDLQKRISELEKKINKSYKPGLGTIMNSIQTHHEKLWFAGKNKNWELANFEIQELRERFVGLKKYHSNKKEIELLGIIKPSIIAIEISIEQNDIENFYKDFQTLTNSCNMCHQATNHEFIQIKIPENYTFSNQEYKNILQNEKLKNN